MGFPLARLGSDHIPIHIQVGTHIPKAQLFKIENFWFEFDGIMELINKSWNMAPIMQDLALNINAKFKYLRAALKKWSRNHSNLHKIIENCNFTLALLDGIEDQRNLSIMEKNFRKIHKAHTAKLLETKRIYWKNRAKMRWAKLGDENTKIFLTVATQSYRRNYITSIKDDDRNYITNHDHKAAIIWNSYKNRLGQSSNPDMSFDLDHLISRSELAHLDDPFTMEEINTVLKEIPPDKAPGPDGFNGLFMKKSWDIIKADFIRLANDFYSGYMNLASINTAYITLIPKVNNPETMKEFRPISLVSMPLKFITKLLANKLQKEIIPMQHQNQYGFIKGKTIHDCLGWAFEYLHLCHLSKKPIIIMKIDFEQAFDKVEFNAIIAMCKALGIGPRFLSWIRNI
jgi:hypothetical protein